MSYFDEVYLKRMNIDGNTKQERIKSKKEKEFNKLFLKNSEYQACIYQVNDDSSDIICSLQPNKWNESKIISNILISTSCRQLKTGDILSIFQKIKEIEYNKTWLVIFCEENITKGYYSYKVICLDNVLNITNEYGTTLYSIPVKFIDSSGTFLEDFFTAGQKITGYREPQEKVVFITKSFDFLKKGTYFEYNGKGFEISGINDMSINNVAYVSVTEKLLSEPEPISSGKIPVDKNVNFFLNNR